MHTTQSASKQGTSWQECYSSINDS